MSLRLILSGIVAAICLLFLLILFSSDPTFDEVFLVAPCAAVLVFVLLLLLAIPLTRRVAAKLLLAVAAFVATGMIGSRFEVTMRPAVRWAFFSSKFKARVLAQPDQASATFKHVEWDGWGGAPVGDWTAYVVFDPTDSLNGVTGRWHPGMVRGVPCDVLRVQRLEPHWYSVALEVDQWWDQCRKE